MAARRHRWVNRNQFNYLISVYVEHYNEIVRPDAGPDYVSIPTPTREQIEKAGSIIAALDEPVFGQRKFPTFTHQVAAAYYEINKGHPFGNGNKRLATFTMLYLLRLNGLTLQWDEDELVEFSKRVAESPAEDRGEWINRIATVIDQEAEPWSIMI